VDNLWTTLVDIITYKIVQLTMESSLLELFVLFLIGLVAGGCGAMLESWTLVRGLRDVEWRLSDLEERLVRETRQRAGLIGREKKMEQLKLEEWARDQAPVPKAPIFSDWYKKKMTS